MRVPEDTFCLAHLGHIREEEQRYTQLAHCSHLFTLRFLASYETYLLPATP